ncbi:MAG: 3-phosphoshikimate 1-carboxyvinyltransferase [Pseudomonadota bacterium]|nr:3-phosphoshikimate 1-carboxyvinyltransferase [Pseudomonadota bacterium]
MSDFIRISDFIDLPPLSGARGTLRLPGSKSISNRILLLSALASGTTHVKGLLDSDDTRVMLDALHRLGVRWQRLEGDNYRVDGVAGTFPVKYANLFLGNAGTAFRSLTAACAMSGGDYTLSGVPRMHERPIGDLVDALRQAGAQIDYTENDGFPPLHILPHENGASEISVKGTVSSQYLTGLLLSAPLLGREVTVVVDGELISKPYVEITLNLMQRFGVLVKRDGWQRFTVPAATYQSPGEIEVEGDASSASYFLAAGAIGHGPVRVEGVGRNSIQGDVRFAEALARMGAEVGFGRDGATSWIECRLGCGDKLHAIDLDCNHIPDAAMTLGLLALFANGTTTLTNIASWRVKETDRITAMATELRKLGATVEEGADFIRITPPAKLTANAEIDTYDDHRMAMCFSLVALGGVPIRINDPKCVNKTFPEYFERFAAITHAQPPGLIG